MFRPQFCVNLKPIILFHAPSIFRHSQAQIITSRTDIGKAEANGESRNSKLSISGSIHRISITN